MVLDDEADLAVDVELDGCCPGVWKPLPVGVISVAADDAAEEAGGDRIELEDKDMLEDDVELCAGECLPLGVILIPIAEVVVEDA